MSLGGLQEVDRGDADTPWRYARFGKCGNVWKSTQLLVVRGCEVVYSAARKLAAETSTFVRGT